MAVWRYEVRQINTEYIDPNEDDGKPDLDLLRFKEGHLENILNYMGESGWKLVGFLPAMPNKDFKGYPANPWVHYAIFKKREKPEDTHTRRQFMRKGSGKLPA